MDFTFNVANFKEHPTKRNFWVFTFKEFRVAGYFENLLTEHKIWFEKFKDEDESVIYFGVKKEDRKQAIQLNYLSHGQYRKPLISNPILRWATIIFFFALISLAITGFVLSR